MCLSFHWLNRLTRRSWCVTVMMNSSHHLHPGHNHKVKPRMNHVNIVLLHQDLCYTFWIEIIIDIMNRNVCRQDMWISTCFIQLWQCFIPEDMTRLNHWLRSNLYCISAFQSTVWRMFTFLKFSIEVNVSSDPREPCGALICPVMIQVPPKALWNIWHNNLKQGFNNSGYVFTGAGDVSLSLS